jgi:hypothetical protein
VFSLPPASASFLLFLYFYPENGGDMFLLNVDVQRTTQNNVLKGSILPNRCCGIPRSNKAGLCRILGSHSGGYEHFSVLGYDSM